MHQEEDKIYLSICAARKILLKIIYGLAIGCIGLTIWPDGAISAATPTKEQQKNINREAKTTSKLQSFLDDKTYFYKREGRHDPFLPFISEETIKAEQEREEVLTGMRRFEPGQLNLVAIVFAENEPMALVEDSVGKGYTIKIGTEIGRTGVVEDILPNKVLIRQEMASFSTNKKYKTIEMILRKEGEQK